MIPRHLPPAWLLAGLVAAYLPGAHAATPSTPAAHTQAISDARAGRYEPALATLEALVQRYPTRSLYRQDLIAVLSWAGRYQACLEASAALRLSLQTPGYVLAAIGKAALAEGQPARAGEAYGLLARQQPGNPDPALGQALAWLDGGTPSRADAALERVLRLARRQPAELEAARAALEARGDTARAAPFRARLLALGQPVPEATAVATTTPVATAQTAVLPAAAPTAPVTAATPASAPVSAAEPARTPVPSALATAQEDNARQIREAQAVLDTDFRPTRYAPIDQALATNAALTTQADLAGEAGVALRLRRDRVVALRARGLYAQALETFQALEQESDMAPAYVLRAAADSLLSLRQPEQATALYDRALQAEARDAAALSGRMYARLEAEDFPAAEASLQALRALDPEALSTQLTQATLLRFADRLDDAQTLVDTLATRAPDNAGVWLAQADLFSARGLPRKAEERYRAVLSVAPDHLRARVGLAYARWAQGDIPEAARMVQTLETEAPEHPAVQRLAREWQRHRDAPVLTTEVTRGFGQGIVAGNSDLVWESSLYSGQYESGLRVFANHHLSKATFGGEQASHERAGLGIEWNQRDLQAQVEVGTDLRNGKDPYWAAGLRWQADDHLSLRARHESQTNDFPVKGRLPDGEAYLGAPTYLHADRTVLGVAWRWNESRRAAVDFSNYGFNDGNHRQALSATWFERLHSAYGRTLDLTLGAYTSRNSLRDALYFNPQRDVALSATLTADWLTWRRYDRSFNQRVAATVGSYHQESDLRPPGGTWARHDYGWNPFYELRYEHEWNWGPDLNTRYGVGWRRFPYDGVHESKGYLYVQLRYRF